MLIKKEINSSIIYTKKNFFFLKLRNFQAFQLNFANFSKKQINLDLCLSCMNPDLSKLPNKYYNIYKNC